MNNELEFTTSDFPTFSALTCPAEKFPAIEEASIESDPVDRNRFKFVFENSAMLRRKLSAFRGGKLRVEPSQYFHVCKQLKQELKYLKDSFHEKSR